MDSLHLPDLGHGVGLEQHVPIVIDLLVHQLRNVQHALAIHGRASARGWPYQLSSSMRSECL
eukprot:5128837-Heterocapsa_arctica.AAC.1